MQFIVQRQVEVMSIRSARRAGFLALVCLSVATTSSSSTASSSSTVPRQMLRSRIR